MECYELEMFIALTAYKCYEEKIKIRVTSQLLVETKIDIVFSILDHFPQPKILSLKREKLVKSYGAKPIEIKQIDKKIRAIPK